MRKINIPVSGQRTALPPAYGGLGEEGWSRGRTFLEIVETAAGFADDLDRAFKAVQVADETRQFFREYPRKVRVMALTAMPAADSLFNVAHAEFLFSLGNSIWMRQFEANRHPDLVQFFQTGTSGNEQPLLIFFGEDKREFARWGPRPLELVDLEAAEAFASMTEREAFRRRFYARSQGRDLACELRERLEEHL